MSPATFIDALQHELQLTQYGQYPTELYDPIRYIMSLGGKRLRPLLTLMAAHLFTDDWKKTVRPALAVEVFHNFTLMHDDIMDRAPLRRGQPTVHEKWNDNIAILSGDVMLVKAYELLLDADADKLKQAMARFTRTAAEVCEGQQMDMNFETRWDVTEAEYIDMIRLKTSVLLGYALELGGLLGGADKETTDLLYAAGVNIGIGFQLKDDLLDVYGDPAKFGKQVGGDIIANKKTFLLIEALEQATGSRKDELTGWLTQTSFDKAEKVRAVTTIYDQLGIRQITEARINDYFGRGFANFDQIQADPDRKEFLLQFTRQLAERES
ncbi:MULTISPECIES: polyprenyl synthetase family protein [Spirosoma]|uniref:Polyprenyl synthetase family protein n=1 Tax=Spirosoma liriopis TaxID=2937440 RepID=A0ABT0HHS3_9BACT|nr:MULTISPECIES: polyprenyl synthetase family protein [Spirosoma]MCK8491714.1 polyprenyl synthetase family protein [Spirosoma liriopis]UHG91074.1 polyprenyl synthetase family protein [Spirosoma oryzicola]